MSFTPIAVSKQEARARAYRSMRAAKVARFPFPIEGRIPNFRGAEQAAARLRELPVYKQARALKVNPDAPQLPVRAMALEDGKTVYMPSPRLRAAFLRIRPETVPPGEYRKAASLSHCASYGEDISLAELGEQTDIDLIVTGSTAVDRRGGRAGKGEGYSDLEYAILRELGHPELPVVTTVHPVQMIEGGFISMEAHDLSVDFIVTPDEIVVTDTPYPKPRGIDWARLSADDLEVMPVLLELRKLRWSTLMVPAVTAPNLRILFVGLNPGRASATRGHHFSGPGNYFWRLLHEAGLTPRKLDPEEDAELLRYGLGVTNIVDRATRGEDDLTWDELLAGGAKLREEVARLSPRKIALLGKQVYRAYAGLSRSATVDWGPQSRQTVPGVAEFALPNPSRRSTIPYEIRLELYRILSDRSDPSQ